MAQLYPPAEEETTSAGIPFPSFVSNLQSTKLVLMNTCASTLALKRIKPNMTFCVNSLVPDITRIR